MKRTCYYILVEINRLLGIVGVLFLIIELIKPKLILAYINLNWWFIFWLVSAIIILFLNNSLTDQEINK